MTSRHLSEKFDGTREFEAARPVKLAGADLKIGDLIDKGKLTVRRLRLLFEQRIIRFADATTAEAIKCPAFDKLPPEALREWLRQHDVYPHPRSTHDALVEKAVQTFEKHREDQAA